VAFATTTDIATRLTRTLTAAEDAAAGLLLEGATGLIADACGKDDDWADSLDPVPSVLRFVCIEAVSRALANPQNVASLQETLGAHSYAVRFRDLQNGGGLYLTGHEERMVRRAVFGRTTGSARVESVADELYGS
jgi:hypothetical protein